MTGSLLSVDADILNRQPSAIGNTGRANSYDGSQDELHVESPEGALKMNIRPGPTLSHLIRTLPVTPGESLVLEVPQVILMSSH